MERATIAVFPGDGIGPEVTGRGARGARRSARERFGLRLEFAEGLIGGGAIDRDGDGRCPTRACALRARRATPCCSAPSAARSGTTRRAPCGPSRRCSGCATASGSSPTCGPVVAHPALLGAAPLKRELLEGVDILFVRELTGGIYFGQPSERRIGAGGREAVDTTLYTEGEVARVTRLAFQLAQRRRKHVTSVDKANILATSRLWREVAHEVAREYPGRRLRGRARRRDGDAPAPPAARLRRGRHREHVRRHPDRRGVDADRLDGHAAVGVARRRAQSPRRSRRALRADPRQRAGHRRAGPRQSARRDPLRRDAAAVLARPAGGRRARSRRPSAACSTPACAPPTSRQDGCEIVGCARWARPCGASWRGWPHERGRLRRRHRSAPAARSAARWRRCCASAPFRVAELAPVRRRAGRPDVRRGRERRGDLRRSTRPTSTAPTSCSCAHAGVRRRSWRRARAGAGALVIDLTQTLPRRGRRAADRAGGQPGRRRRGHRSAACVACPIPSATALAVVLKPLDDGGRAEARRRRGVRAGVGRRARRASTSWRSRRATC